MWLLTYSIYSRKQKYITCLSHKLTQYERLQPTLATWQFRMQHTSRVKNSDTLYLKHHKNCCKIEQMSYTLFTSVIILRGRCGSYISNRIFQCCAPFLVKTQLQPARHSHLYNQCGYSWHFKIVYGNMLHYTFRTLTLPRPLQSLILSGTNQPSKHELVVGSFPCVGTSRSYFVLLPPDEVLQ